MNRVRVRVAAIGRAVLLSTIAVSTLAAAAPSPDARAKALSDRMLAALVEANGVPGMSASVWRDGKVVWTGVAGLRDVDKGMPVKPATRFRLASVSKAFTAMAAAQLRERGKLDPEAPVQTYVQGLSPDWPKITSRQLSAHTSGLTHYTAADMSGDTLSKTYATVTDAVAIFNGRPLLTAPGERYSYSSWGYTLLSAVIEAAGGKPFLDVIAQDVAPGLNVGPEQAESDDPRHSRPYAFVDGVARRAPPTGISYTWAGGGLSASTPDLATFGGRVLDGQVVSPATFAWMREPTLLNDGKPAGEGDYILGFGWRLGTDNDGRPIVHHAGITTGARSVLMLWPGERTSAAVASNAMWVSSIEQTAMMLAAPFRPAPAGLKPAPCPVAAAAYDGKFGDAPVTGTVRFQRVDGVCTGRLETKNAFSAWFNPFMQKDADAVTVIGVDASGGLSRAALVTPSGLYDLRATADGRFVARVTAQRSLDIRFGLAPSP